MAARPAQAGAQVEHRMRAQLAHPQSGRGFRNSVVRQLTASDKAWRGNRNRLPLLWLYLPIGGADGEPSVNP